MELYQTNEKKRKFFHIWENIVTNDQNELKKLQYTLIPLPDTWLKFSMKQRQFDSTGFITKVDSIHQVNCTGSTTTSYKGLSTIHYSPLHPHAPLCSSHVPKAYAAKVIIAANTFRCGAKQYLKGDTAKLTAEQIEEESIFVIDVNKVGNVQLNIEVMENNLSVEHLHTTVKITKTTDEDMLNNAKEFGSVVSELKSSGVRDDDGNPGEMHTFGLHQHNGEFMRFAEARNPRFCEQTYKAFVDSFMRQLDEKFPMELSTMTQTEYSRGISSKIIDHPANETDNQVEGSCAVSVSVNFASSQHLDVRDGSIGAILWVTEGDISVDDIYFLLANAEVDYNGKKWKGVAIKLTDGIMISFDGRMIRHGTTECTRVERIYGFHISANAITMRAEVVRNIN